MDHCAPLPDEEYMLGPFFDLDGEEIVPLATEATDRAIEACIGHYRLCSNVTALHGQAITIDGRLMTEFIQQDWTRLMEDERKQIVEGELPSYSVGFLAAYQGLTRAVGRLAEDVVCKELLKVDVFQGDAIENVYSVSDAFAAGHIERARAGKRCDDLVIITRAGRKYLGEIKASVAGRSYLLSSIPKALLQLRRLASLNADITGVLLVLVSVLETDKFIMLLAGSLSDLQSQPDAYWRDLYAGLLPARRPR